MVHHICPSYLHLRPQGTAPIPIPVQAKNSFVG